MSRDGSEFKAGSQARRLGIQAQAWLQCSSGKDQRLTA